MDKTNTFEHSLSCPKKRHCLKSFSGDSPAVPEDIFVEASFKDKEKL